MSFWRLSMMTYDLRMYFLIGVQTSLLFSLAMDSKEKICPYCEGIFSVTKIKDHIGIEHLGLIQKPEPPVEDLTEIKFQCEQCPAHFIRNTSLEKHKRIVHSNCVKFHSVIKTKVPKSDPKRRVYKCPHCLKCYNWNYNLNRHLKYECGKENAFRCRQCGLKFPHKQNCIMHVKRIHKVVRETQDQYVAEGLVLFKG